MTDYTPNYNFQLPDFDQRFWHDEMRRILKGFDSILAKYVAVGNVKGVWANSTSYVIGDVLIDEDVGNLYECAITHVSANTGTFADDRAIRTSYWINASITNRYRGSWATGTVYRTGDFVVSGNKYAVATQSFTSGASFADDETAGKLTTLIDLAAIPASAVPVPNVSTALHYVRQNGAGDGYEVVPISTIQGALSLGSLAYLSAITIGSIDSAATPVGKIITSNGSGGATWGDQPALATQYVSPDSTITLTGSQTFAHGLGSTPYAVFAYLVNVNAEHNYTTGMLTQCMAATSSAASAGAGSCILGIVPDATNITVRFPFTIFICNYTSGAAQAITAANWHIRIVAYR